MKTKVYHKSFIFVIIDLRDKFSNPAVLRQYLNLITLYVLSYIFFHVNADPSLKRRGSPTLPITSNEHKKGNFSCRRFPKYI